MAECDKAKRILKKNKGKVIGKFSDHWEHCDTCQGVLRDLVVRAPRFIKDELAKNSRGIGPHLRIITDE